MTTKPKTILFLHGLESKPGGTKPRHLEKLGHTLINPALPRDNFIESVKIAQKAYDTHNPDIVVGSSRGGAVAMSIKLTTARLVLIAPAWRNYNVDSTIDNSTVILHTKNDKIVAYKDSELIAAGSGAVLIECGQCHRMNDSIALRFLEAAVESDFLRMSL